MSRGQSSGPETGAERRIFSLLISDSEYAFPDLPIEKKAFHRRMEDLKSGFAMKSELRPATYANMFPLSTSLRGSVKPAARSK